MPIALLRAPELNLWAQSSYVVEVERFVSIE